MSDRYCPNCGAFLIRDVCESCGGDFRVQSSALSPSGTAFVDSSDPFLKGYITQLDIARQMGVSDDKLAFMRELLEEVKQLRGSSPDDASFMKAFQEKGLAQKYATAASAAMISSMMGGA